MRRLGLGLILCVLPVLGHAQDQQQTLADIRVELGALAAEFNALKAELVASGAAANGSAGGDALTRMDTIEAELARLNAQTEAIELKLNRVVSDGTNRIGDLEYRLCEVTDGCDPSTLGATPALGDAGGVAPAEPLAAGTATGVDAGAGTGSDTGAGVELAVAEQEDFDHAKAVYGQSDFTGAADLFATYAQDYPGGPLVPEALYLRGEALNQLGDTSNAARAYLDAFNANPAGPFAPDALLKLGQGLGTLGQVPEACVTLGEVGVRFPTSAAATQSVAAMQGLGCQ